MIDDKLYILIAIVVGITTYWVLNKLNEKGKFVTKPLYKWIVSIFTSALWMLYVPAVILCFILHECAWSLADWDWKGMWQAIKDAIKNLFKRKKK